MLRITLLMVFVLAGTWGDARSLLAEAHVVVGAGIAEEPRTGNQFELALAAATGLDDDNQAIAGGLVHIKFISSTDGIESITAEVERIDIFIEDGIPLRAEVACMAEVKLSRGNRLRGVAGTINVTDMRKWSLYFPEAMLEPIQEAAVFSGGSSVQIWDDPHLMFVAVGEGSTVPSVYQAAGAIGAEGRAIGHLSLLANRDNGDLVRVQGAVDGAAVGFYVGRRRLQLHLAGVAAVDVFRPDNTSPDTCFGDFTFVGNEGPHGPFRIDAPDCRDPLAGIEGSDIGTGPAEMSTASWPRP